MALELEVVTDGKNDKTEQNDQEYVYNKRTRDGTFFGCADFFWYLQIINVTRSHEMSLNVKVGSLRYLHV